MPSKASIRVRQEEQIKVKQKWISNLLRPKKSKSNNSKEEIVTDAKIFQDQNCRTANHSMVLCHVRNHVLAIFKSPKYLYNREKQRLKEKVYA